MKFKLPLSRGHLPIGVDLAGRWIKAVQVERNGAGHRVCAAVRMSRPDHAAPFGPSDASVLAGVLDRAGFQGNALVVGAPREMLFSDVLDLPPRASGAPIEQLARMELARANKCDPSGLELGVWDLPTSGRSGEGTPVFATALPHQKAEALVDTMQAVGLNVIAIDAPACAMARASRKLCEAVQTAGPAPMTALMDLGWNSALLVVVYEGVVVYERSIAESALSRLYASVKTKVGIEHDAADLVLLSGATGSGESAKAPPPDPRAAQLLQESRACLTEFLEALVPEVERSLAYTVHRYQGWPLARLLLTGDGGSLLGLVERLGLALAIPVSAPRLEQLAPAREHMAQPGSPCSFATALGLAQYAHHATASGRKAA